MEEHNDTERLISMRNAMIFVYVLLTAIAITVIAVFLIIAKNRALMGQSQNYGASAAEQSASNVEFFCQNIKSASNIIYEDKEYWTFYPHSEEVSPEEDDIKEKISSLFSKVGYMSDYCDLGIIYSNNSYLGFISDGTLDLLGEQAFSSTEELLADNSEKWNVFYSDNVSRACYLKRINENAVFIASAFSTRFSHVFANHVNSSNLFLYVTDENNRIIYCTDNSQSASGDPMPYEIVEKAGNSDNISVADSSGVFASKTLYNGWKVYSVVYPSTKGLFGSLHIETFIVIFSITAFIVYIIAGFLIASFYLSKRRVPRIVEDRIDPVSGVLSPYYCEERISDLIEISLAGGTWAFALVKINDYELIEERLGSDFTNEALRKISDIISECFGEKAAVGLDTDHDFVMFCDFSDFDIFKAHNDLKAKFSELCSSFNTVTVGENGDYKLDIRVGVCIYPDHGKTFDELEFKARQALNAAVENDAEMICYYDEKKSGGGKQ